MATTTNYSWTTPDDTALVKDGAAAIRSLGTAIDTTVFNNAGAAIAKTIVDAKGDIIAATAADTVSRLAVGANDTVLTADSTAATGLKWATVAAGGMTLLSTTTLSGTSTTISSISQSYNSLAVLITGVSINANSNFTVNVNNASETSSVSGVADAGAPGTMTDTVIGLRGNQVNIASSNTNNAFYLEFHNYTSTADYKPLSLFSTFQKQGGGNSSTNYAGGWMSTSAISSLVFAAAGNTFGAGTVKIYGVK